MPSQREAAEHFVTLFDSRFLVLGMALHSSLREFAPHARLWIICMDALVEQQIIGLGLPNVSTISLDSIETAELLAVKTTRTVGEYCWTLTPFSPQAVFDREPQARRVTYLDSDLFFFSSPASLFEEFEASGKHVLITEHAYAPSLDRSTKSGRFCVQFMVFRRTAESVKVLKWWQDKCIEWCFDRNEEGRFGDQKYLDQWPALFPDEIHVLQQVHRTLAPWNVDYFLSKHPPVLIPVFYHFQSFRILSASHARLVVGFRLSHAVDRFYERYLANIRTQIRFLAGHGIGLTKMPEPKRRFGMLRKIYMRLSNRVRYARLDS